MRFQAEQHGVTHSTEDSLEVWYWFAISKQDGTQGVARFCRLLKLRLD